MWQSPEVVERLALLWERLWVADEPSASLLAEMRAIEDRLGLNPRAMLQLRWRIGPPTEAKVSPIARPRRKLKVVDDGPLAGA